MRPPGYTTRRWATGACGGAPAGPALTTLRSVAARVAAVIRGIAIVYIAAQVVIWHSFYTADLLRLAGPAVAVAWATGAVAYLWRRWPAWQLASIDSGLYVALALCAGWCVPPAMRGDTASWLYIVMAAQHVVPAWFAPTEVFAPLALASGAAYWAGAALVPAAGSGDGSPAAAAAVMLAASAGAWCGYRMVYRRATAADAALARADRDSREQYVVLSRNIERREHERLLHDTVLNTLTALARAGGSDPGEVVGRCRHDVTLMEHALSDPGDPATTAGRACGDLLADIEAVATEMRARGLEVRVESTVGAPAGTRVPGPAGPPAGPAAARVPPAPVAAAMAHAVREALANVISHAGTGEAWVEVSLAAPGGEVTEPGSLQVTVWDMGVGFDPERLDPARLGLRRSIIERIADCGGRASVWSAPGEGTVVSLCWTAPAHSSQETVAVANSGLRSPRW